MSLVTTVTNKSVSKFINSIENEGRREDAKALLKIFKEATGKTPKIWGDNFIIGFGKYKYKRKGGKQEYEWFNCGFAPRKSNITIYLTCDLSKMESFLKKLGKHSHGKGCLYIKKLDDIHLPTLKKMIAKSKDNSWF